MSEVHGVYTLLQIGKRQRLAILAIGIQVLITIASKVLGAKLGDTPLVNSIFLALLLASLAVTVFLLFNIFMLTSLLGHHVLLRVLWCLFMFVPILGIIVALILVNTAGKILAAHGVRTGFLGANREDLLKLSAQDGA